MTERKHMPIFRILRLVRDARSTKKADRALLYALVLRCRPAEKFIAWPSYARLALDTLLDEVTLQRAAKRLEEAGLIKRVVRANRSNHFYINVALLQDQAAKAKAEDAAKRASDDVFDDSSFERPVMDDDDADQPPVAASPAEAAVLDDLDTKPAQKDYRTQNKVAGADELVRILHDNFPDHPSLTGPTAKNITTDCINSCLAAADGEVAATALTLLWNFANLDTKTEVSHAVWLGGFIKSRFPNWLAEWRTDFLSHLDTLCDHGDLVFEPDTSDIAPLFERHLRSVVGTHLKDIKWVPEDLALTAVISPAYKIANLLSRSTATPVSPERIPASADEATLDRCRSLTMDEAWREGLRATDDPVEYILTTLNDGGLDVAESEPDSGLKETVECDDGEFDDEEFDDVEAKAEEFWTREPMMRQTAANY